MQITEKFITVDCAADLAGLSHWTIRRWLAVGRLTHYRAASRVVVDREELLALMAPRKMEAGNVTAIQL